MDTFQCHVTMCAFNCISIPRGAVAEQGLAVAEWLVGKVIRMTTWIFSFWRRERESYPYTVPSFPVITAMLREVKFSFGACEDSDYVSFDGYMRECSLVNHPLPAVARIISG